MAKLKGQDRELIGACTLKIGELSKSVIVLQSKGADADGIMRIQGFINLIQSELEKL